MQAAALGHGSLASRALECLYTRPVSYQNAAHVSRYFPPQPLCLWRSSHSRRSTPPRSTQEDFADVEQAVTFVVPSVLTLPIESRGASETTSNVGNEQVSTGVPSKVQQTGTVRKFFEVATKAVGDAPVQSVGQVALYGGIVGFGMLVAGAILNSVDSFPLAPEALQTVGVVYSVFIGSQVLRRKRVSFPPSSPFKMVIELVDSRQSKAENLALDMGNGVAALVDKLTKERDTAVNQAEEFRRAAARVASVVSEKEALEALSMQLADERDGSISEVAALKDAIGAMTNRIKAIEEMLEREVSQLKEQNQALETVSLQLAAERDAAIQEIDQLRSSTVANPQLEEEKEALEVVAIQLAQERDTAHAEIEELKKVVGILRDATATASGLTPEQEVFIKARVRDIRSQFIDVERLYDDQKDKVDRFILHLVEEYGAPHDWTADYIKQFLDSSPTKLSPPALTDGLSQVGNLSVQSL